MELKFFTEKDTQIDRQSGVEFVHSMHFFSCSIKCVSREKNKKTRATLEPTSKRILLLLLLLPMLLLLLLSMDDFFGGSRSLDSIDGAGDVIDTHTHTKIQPSAFKFHFTLSSLHTQEKKKKNRKRKLESTGRKQSSNSNNNNHTKLKVSWFKWDTRTQTSSVFLSLRLFESILFSFVKISSSSSRQWFDIDQLRLPIEQRDCRSINR